MAKNFGLQIKRADASAYFKRYIQLRKKCIPGLKGHFKADTEALRFYTGRHSAKNPLLEDVVFLFDKDSVQRLLNVFWEGKCNSLVVFMGTRNEIIPADGETDGRPTILMFPALQETVDAKVQFTLSDLGEEHPGSGGGGTGGSGSVNEGGAGIEINEIEGNIQVEIPKVLFEGGFHII